MEKVCAKCGKHVEFSQLQKTQYFESLGAPTENKGAVNYFYMWHNFIEVCPHCGYASLDISTPPLQHKLSIINTEIVDYLQSYKFNGVVNTLNAANSEIANGNDFNAIKLIFQSSDMLYNAIMSINEYEEVDDSIDNMSIKAEKYAESLWAIGLKTLNQYVTNHNGDTNAKLLLGCMLVDGTQEEQETGLKILKSVKKEKLSIEQLSIVEYVISML